jgi:tripartite-type tricarboxylate transporter receptor subunit TctC
MTMNRTRRALLATACALLPLAAFAQGDAYPDRAVRIVVPYPAGGYYDRVARTMAEALKQTFRHGAVVENRVGANGVIGADYVAKAPPDGYTLLLAAVGPNAISPALAAKLAYDPVNDFAPISLLVSAPNVLVVPASSPAKNVVDLRKLLLSKGGRANYAHNGVGSSVHLAMELFKGAAGVQASPIPYKGSAPAVVAVTAGEVDAAFGSVLDILPLVQSGKLRAIAVGGTERLSAFPDVPTVAEQGFPGFETSAWSGLMAPAGTPPAIVARLNAAVNAALRDPATIKRLSPGGELQMLGGASEHFGAYLRSEIAKWQKVVKANNIQAD